MAIQWERMEILVRIGRGWVIVAGILGELFKKGKKSGEGWGLMTSREGKVSNRFLIAPRQAHPWPQARRSLAPPAFWRCNPHSGDAIPTFGVGARGRRVWLAGGGALLYGGGGGDFDLSGLDHGGKLGNSGFEDGGGALDGGP